MKKVFILAPTVILAFLLNSCKTTKQSISNPQPPLVEVASSSPKPEEPAPNIHVTVNVEPAIASTSQDVFLYTSYCGNTYLLDSVRTDGSTTLKLKGYIPFQNEAEITFEKRGARKISLILSPGDSISFDAPKENEVAFENEVEIPQLSAQTEWNAYLRKNRILRNKVDSLVSLLVHTPKTDTLRLQTLQQEFDADSLAIHDMYVDLANSSNPYLADHSLIFLNIDYHEDYLYKDSLLKRFPDYAPIKRSFNLIPQAVRTSESKRVWEKINRIKSERASVIKFSDAMKKRQMKRGQKLDITLRSINGNTERLKKYEGKYVLVDFWASWCKPCIDNMRPLIALQKKYANDFEVCAITLDKLPGAWKRRIESIGMQNFNHFIGVDLNTGKIYPDIETLGFKSIPQNYLLDREGKVIAINIYGEELVKKLEELIKK